MTRSTANRYKEIPTPDELREELVEFLLHLRHERIKQLRALGPALVSSYLAYLQEFHRDPAVIARPSELHIDDIPHFAEEMEKWDWKISAHGGIGKPMDFRFRLVEM